MADGLQAPLFFALTVYFFTVRTSLVVLFQVTLAPCLVFLASAAVFPFFSFAGGFFSDWVTGVTEERGGQRTFQVRIHVVGVTPEPPAVMLTVMVHFGAFLVRAFTVVPVVVILIFGLAFFGFTVTVIVDVCPGPAVMALTRVALPFLGTAWLALRAVTARVASGVTGGGVTGGGVTGAIGVSGPVGSEYGPGPAALVAATRNW